MYYLRLGIKMICTIYNNHLQICKTTTQFENMINYLKSISKIKGKTKAGMFISKKTKVQPKSVLYVCVL